MRPRWLAMRGCIGTLKEDKMRKLLLTIAAAVALLAPGGSTDRANAITVGTPAGLRTAIDTVALTDQAHWRRGWGYRHVRFAWRPHRLAWRYRCWPYSRLHYPVCDRCY